MPISLKQLTDTAKLARIKLTKKEEQVFLPQLESVLDYIDQLKKVDTAGIKPTFQVTNLTNSTRSDTVTPSLIQDQALSTATKTESGYFVVPKTIDKHGS